jgi:hypothetical protein
VHRLLKATLGIRTLFLISLSLLLSCTVDSHHGASTPVAIAVRVPHAIAPAVTARADSQSASKLWTRLLAWLWEPRAAIAQTVSPYRVVIDVGAADLPSQVVTVPLDSLAPQSVTVQLDVPSGAARTFRVTVEQQPAGQSGYVPVYAGCHTGVDLQPDTPTNVTIALAETTTCLRVIVLGAGPQLDQPLAGIRVLRHDAFGAFVEDRISDSNGVADFGELAPASQNTFPLSFGCNRTAAPQQCAILSFVLARATPPASETVITLSGIPMSGDIRFNVSQNQFGGVLPRDLPIQFDGTGTLAPSTSCSAPCYVSVGVSGRANAEVAGTAITATVPVVAYQRQSNDRMSVAVLYRSGTQATGCASNLDTNSLTLDLTSLTNPVAINFFNTSLSRLIGKRTRYNGAILDIRCPGCSAMCSLAANEHYEVLLEELLTPSIQGQHKEYGVLSSSLAPPPSTSAQITYAARGPGFMSMCTSQQLNSGEIMWCSGSGYQDADALVWETRWTVAEKVYQRVEIFAPYDSPFPLSRLVTLPTDLNQLLPPDPANSNPVTTKLSYVGVARADGTLTWPIPVQDTVLHGDRFQRLMRPLIGGTGIFDNDVIFNGQTIRHFESSYIFTD